MVVGLLWANHLLTGGKQLADQVHTQLCGPLAERTNAVSAAYLRHASQGQFSAPLMEFAAAITHEVPAQHAQHLGAAWSRIQAVGHHSGTDTLYALAVVYGKT